MQQINAKRVKDKTHLCGDDDQVGILQRDLNLTVRTNDIFTTQNPSWRMRRKTDHLTSARRADLGIANKKDKPTEW